MKAVLLTFGLFALSACTKIKYSEPEPEPLRYKVYYRVVDVDLAGDSTFSNILMTYEYKY